MKTTNRRIAAINGIRRGLDKVWDALVKVFATQGNSVTHHTVMTTFTAMGMPYHYWCMMD